MVAEITSNLKVTTRAIPFFHSSRVVVVVVVVVVTLHSMNYSLINKNLFKYSNNSSIIGLLNIRKS
jgi:hypothetical protein